LPVHVEDWGPEYGSPYQIENDENGAANVELLEDGGNTVLFHPGSSKMTERMAFVDGVRQIEARLYYSEGELLARGVAGAYGYGTVLWSQDKCDFGQCHVRRVAIWGSGIVQQMPKVSGGWEWDVVSVADKDPKAPETALQEHMLKSEVQLAGEICRMGYLTVRDGPLSFYHATEPVPIVGYVKTHQKALLPAECQARVPALSKGERTSVFSLGDRYACYTRLADSTSLSGPWSGIVRLEVPQIIGLAEAIELLGQVTSAIVPFAGIPHRDPRAPQNLQPVSALEAQLRRLMGSPKLATRAVKDAVLSLILDSEKPA
jgi:hypothetical protein